MTKFYYYIKILIHLNEENLSSYNLIKTSIKRSSDNHNLRKYETNISKPDILTIAQSQFY